MKYILSTFAFLQTTKPFPDQSKSIHMRNNEHQMKQQHSCATQKDCPSTDYCNDNGKCQSGGFWGFCQLV